MLNTRPQSHVLHPLPPYQDVTSFSQSYRCSNIIRARDSACFTPVRDSEGPIPINRCVGGHPYMSSVSRAPWADRNAFNAWAKMQQ